MANIIDLQELASEDETPAPPEKSTLSIAC